MKVKLLVEGGDMKPGPALSQKLGPIGVNISQVIQKVNDSTKDFKGLKVPVELDVDASTKEFDISVFSPPVSELLKKELGLEKGSGTQTKLYVGNASIEQIIHIAKTKLPNLLAKDLKAAVKTIVGTCASLGILVENKLAIDAKKEIDQGKYDAEISGEKVETSPEKRTELDKYFETVKDEQEKIIQKEEEVAKAAEAEKVEGEEGAEEKKPEEEEEKVEGKEEKTEEKPKE